MAFSTGDATCQRPALDSKTPCIYRGFCTEGNIEGCGGGVAICSVVIFFTSISTPIGQAAAGKPAQISNPLFHRLSIGRHRAERVGNLTRGTVVHSNHGEAEIAAHLRRSNMPAKQQE